MGRHRMPGPEDPADEPSHGHGRPLDEDLFGDEEAFSEDEGSPAGGAFAARPADEYPDFPPRQAEAASPPPSRPRPPLLRRGHRGLGDWQGGHRNEAGRRGVSIGVIVALVAVVVVVGTVILWRFFGDALSNRSHKAAGRCVGGKEAVAVIADPSIADQMQQFAESYNQSAAPVG